MGVLIDCNLNWEIHINDIFRKLVKFARNEVQCLLSKLMFCLWFTATIQDIFQSLGRRLNERIPYFSPSMAQSK